MTDQRVAAIHPDQSVHSPAGRLRFTSHTGVADFDMACFARLRLGLFEGKRVIWTLETHGSAQQLWVDDDGWTGVLFGDDRMVLFDPAGRVVAEADALEVLRRDARSARLIHRSTAGDYWDSHPVGVLVRCEGVPCFSLRTFWGARVFLRADAAPLSPGCIDVLRAAEVAAARARLADLGRPFDSSAAARAATLLGVERCGEAIPALERGSDLLLEAQSFTSLGGARGARGGRISVSVHTLRIACGLALVRLGGAPTRAPGYHLKWGDDDELSDRPADWLAQREQIRSGLTHAELHERVGAPTYLQWRSTSCSIWWYDAAGLSVGAEFDGGVATAVHVDREQAWIENFSRERHLFD